jgi:hypothetical protein
MLDRIVTGLAGYLAEKKIGRRGRSFSWQADRESAAEQALQWANGDEISAKLMLRLGYRRAELLLELHWEAVVAIASALIQEQRIGRDGLMHLFRDASSRPRNVADAHEF